MARFSVLLALLLAAAAASAQPDKGSGLRMMGVSAEELEATAPTSPNPFLAYLAAGVAPDFEYWTAKTAFDGVRRARTRSLRGFRSSPSAAYRERERAVFNRNDAPDEAERIPAELFGRAGDEPIVAITGTLEPPTETPTRTAVSTEDAASGALAPYGLRVTAGSAAIATARIGDGPFGTTSGDVDVYEITVPAGGTYVEIAVRTPASDLDPVMALYGPYGEWVTTVDDSIGRDPVEGRVIETPGTYRLFVWGYGTEGLSDRTTAGSGGGAGSTGVYELHVSSAVPDVDSFAVDLEAGDVLGAVTSAPVEDLAIVGPDGALRMRSQTDISGLYPTDGPLMSPYEIGAFSGGISAAIVAPVAGTYTVSVTGQGDYSLVVQGARPGHERPGGQAVQTLYVEFGGGTYHPSRELAGTRDTTVLSPLRAFLPRWGLAPADEDAVIDATLATLRRVLRDDLRGLPGMSGLDLRILNDRDHPDPGPGVNRLVIAGTSAEIGKDGFLGQASTVDVGNFRQDDVAYIVLGALSAPLAERNGDSLNQFPVDSTRTKADLVGLGVGTVAAHEAGHFFGLHHTENENAVQNVQDAGGTDLAPRLFLGPDRAFGPGDGRGVAFRADDLYQSHQFWGVQRSPEALALGLHSAGGATDAALRAAGFSPAARAAATAQPRTARVSLADDFASDANGWTWSAATSGSAVAVRGGALRITAGSNQTLRVPFKHTGGAVGADVAVRFDLRHAAGCEVHGAGVFVRRADEAYTRAVVDGQGEAWSLIDHWSGSAWDTIAGWEQTDGLASGAWNAVEVVVLGPRLTLLVGGRVVRTATVPEGAGQAGLIITSCGEGTTMSYDVDNLTAVALDPPGAVAGLRSAPGAGPVPTATEAGGSAQSGD